MPTVVTTVFVDILGFAQLVEGNEWSLDLLDSFYSSSKSLDDIRAERIPSNHRPSTDPLDAVFSAFHRTLEINIDRSLRASHLSAIVFSDSAFVAFEHPEIAFDFAQTVMRDVLSVEVPVRMGIGAGSFKALRFKTDTADKIALHTSHFLGTSVTRAHAAESCGISGMRILLHPGLEIPQDFPEQVCDIPPSSKKLELNVTQELGYLHPMTHEYPPVAGDQTWHAKNLEIRRAINRMRDRAPEDKQFQYDATLERLDAMRERMGLPIILDFDDLSRAD